MNRDENKHWKTLLSILEDHTDWFHELIQALFYPEEHDSCLPRNPTSFSQWLVHANRQKDIQPEIIEKLAAVHADLFKSVDVMVGSAQENGDKPSHKNFQKSLTLYEEFLGHIRRLEKDLFLEEGGYNPFTGLRSKNMLSSDMERELHRLERQGKNFCIALVKIDNFALLSKNKQESDACIKLVADLIKLSVRSFDDAYYMGEDEFLLSLKQSSVSGGVSALERLRKELDHQDITSKEGFSADIPLSISCCVAEPVSGDNFENLMKNLRADLKSSNEKTVGTVLEHQELSPLQRYIQETEKDSS